jgi:dihydrofolate reductase
LRSEVPGSTGQKGSTGEELATPRAQRVVLVAAVADNGVIGVDGDLPWHLPEDFAHFRRTTLGHVVVMGRRTFESMGRPLPGRTNVVITRQPDWTADGVMAVGSLEEALREAAGHSGDVMVIGGGEVYAQALPLADEQVITEVRLSPEGDTTYPPYDPAQWREVRREHHRHDGVEFDIVWRERRRPVEVP